MHTSQSGFTIIEVMLFLGVSSLLLIVAFTGVRGRNQAAQFTDSMRSLASFLEKTYADLLNGVNYRPDTVDCRYSPSGTIVDAGSSELGKSDCLLLGRLIKFSNGSSSVDTHFVVGEFLDFGALSSISGGDLDYIKTAKPHIYSNLDSDYQILWGTKYIQVSKPEFDSSTFGFLRSPNSTSIYPVIYKGDLSGINPKLDLNDSSKYEFGNNALSKYCFVGANGQDAEITISGGGGDYVHLDFDTGCSK